MNWYELKSRCIDEVARDIVRGRLGPEFNSLTFVERMAAWAGEQKKAEPEAIEKILSMTNMELLDLISEVAGAAEG